VDLPTRTAQEFTGCPEGRWSLATGSRLSRWRIPLDLFGRLRRRPGSDFRPPECRGYSDSISSGAKDAREIADILATRSIASGSLDAARAAMLGVAHARPVSV